LTYQLIFVPLLVIAAPQAAAQVPAQPPTQSQSTDRISFGYGGMRRATLLSWTIDANGQGEVKAQTPLGWAVANTDLGIGDYRFADGAHRFDMPMAQLRRKPVARSTQTKQVDMGCRDHGERVSWVLAYLGAKVGEPTMGAQ
jgi:hypothetical protein